MLEMLVLVGLVKGMAALMETKGRNPLALQILAVVGWIGGEILGAIIAVIYFALQRQEPGLAIYPFMLVVAALGGGFPFLIALVIPAKQPEFPYMPIGNQPAQPFDPTNPYQSSNPYAGNVYPASPVYPSNQPYPGSSNPYPAADTRPNSIFATNDQNPFAPRQ